MALPKVHRVRADDLKVGMAVERKEHPWAGERTIKHLARDHLQKNPNAYSGGGCGGESTTVVLNQNVKAIPARKRKRQPPRPQNTMPDWIRY